jgi:hypothetical protein
MQNLRKKNETDTDRISELGDKMIIKGKTEELLVK